MKKKIAFVCFGNSCRSQMAEGWGRYYAGDKWEVYSAGKIPLGEVSREAIKSMAKHGIDISDQYSKGLGDIPLPDLDVFVSMGCGPSKEVITFNFAGQTYDWNILDPYQMGQKAFDEVCLVLKEKIKKLFHDIQD